MGTRMLPAWAEGVQGVRVYAVGECKAGVAFEGAFAQPKRVIAQ